MSDDKARVATAVGTLAYQKPKSDYDSKLGGCATPAWKWEISSAKIFRVLVLG